MHYKRGYPRTTGGRAKFDKWKSKKLGDDWHWMSTWPRWWDIVFHNRPRRRRDQKMIRNILLGKVEADNATWATSKKPHNYYW